MPKVIVFVTVLLSFVNPMYVPFFLEMAAVNKKGMNVATTYQAPFLAQNLTRIRWRAITTTNNEKKRPKALYICIYGILYK